MCDNIILGLALEMNKRKTGSMSRTFMTNKDYPGHADFAPVTAGKHLAEMGLGLRWHIRSKLMKIAGFNFFTLRIYWTKTQLFEKER